MQTPSMPSHPGYQLFMLVLCVLVLALVAIEAVVPLDAEVASLVWRIDLAVCLLFLVDFGVSFKQAPSKLNYMLTWGWIDLVSSVPLVGPLRLGRVARLAPIIRFLRAFRSARVLLAQLRARPAKSAVFSALIATTLVLSLGALTVLAFERGGPGNIQTAGDALWWAFVTLTTVGYGDFYPVTPEGRIAAVFLMATGMGLFGTFTAFVASLAEAPRQEAANLLTGNGA